MIEPQILYGVTCDRCGETLINSNDNSAWYDRSTAEEEASEEDWHSVSSHHYCPNCYREDDDGNRTIKAPFPYYVQKINRFMNRIAKSYPCRIVEEDDHFASRYEDLFMDGGKRPGMDTATDRAGDRAGPVSFFAS